MTPEEAFGNIVASLPDDFEDAGEISLVYEAIDDRSRLEDITDEAIDRINDILMQDGKQACKEAEKFIERAQQ